MPKRRRSKISIEKIIGRHMQVSGISHHNNTLSSLYFKQIPHQKSPMGRVFKTGAGWGGAFTDIRISFEFFSKKFHAMHWIETQKSKWFNHAVSSSQIIFVDSHASKEIRKWKELYPINITLLRS